MKFTAIIIPALALFIPAACSKKIAPPPPDVMAVPEVIAQVPPSEIDVPLTISLQPLYTLAESYVDKEFSSEGWPDKWVYDGCNTRYMYHFRRGPLLIKAAGSRAELDFTGYYKVKGAQRGCIAGVGITPWSPACTCGFNEPERRVQIGFSAGFSIRPDYRLAATIGIKPVQPLDACEMCFFKTDITPIIINNIKPQLDSARLMVERQLAAYNLRPWFELLWAQLQQPVPLAGYGQLQIQPEQLRLGSLQATGNQLQMVLGLRARPLVSIEPLPARPRSLPALAANPQTGGFNVYADAKLRYDSLSQLINREFGGTRIEMDKGLVKNKHVIIESIELKAGQAGKLLMKATISGSANGFVYLTGKPVYDSATCTVSLQNLDFDIKTREWLVKTAGWLLDKKLTRRLQQAAVLNLRPYTAPLKERLNQQMTRTWMKGVSSTGQIQVVEISTLLPQPDYLFVRAHAAGALQVMVAGINF